MDDGLGKESGSRVKHEDDEDDDDDDDDDDEDELLSVAPLNFWPSSQREADWGEPGGLFACSC